MRELLLQTVHVCCHSSSSRPSDGDNAIIIPITQTWKLSPREGLPLVPSITVRRNRSVQTCRWHSYSTPGCCLPRHGEGPLTFQQMGAETGSTQRVALPKGPSPLSVRGDKHQEPCKVQAVLWAGHLIAHVPIARALFLLWTASGHSSATRW